MLLSRLTRYLTSEVTPHANQLDSHPQLLSQAFSGLGREGLLAVRTPACFGGLEADQSLFVDYLVTLAQSSFALAFLVAQHESCADILAKGDNPALAEALLPKMMKGVAAGGLGIAHFRNEKQRQVVAERVTGGYRVNGRVGWVSGYQLFDHIMLGFGVDDHRTLALIPFRNEKVNGGEVTLSAPAELSVIQSTNTVSVTLNNVWVADERVVVKPSVTWGKNADRGIRTHACFILGLFSAALKALECVSTEQSKLKNYLTVSHQRYSNWRQQIIDTASIEQLIGLRVEIHQRTSEALTVAASLLGGRAVLKASTLQRLHRELLQLAVIKHPLFSETLIEQSLKSE